MASKPASVALMALALALAGAPGVKAQGGPPSAATGEMTSQAQPGLTPRAPVWGASGFKPTAANLVFVTADGCALCHSASLKASAMWSPTGEDVSQYNLWRGSIMAQSARDPYWRAQVAKETSRHPESAAATEALCVRCHAPMGHHTQRLAGGPALSVAQATADPLAVDGVSCAVCHQIQPDGLGSSATYDGNPVILEGRRIFGPYEQPAEQPMFMHSAYTPVYAEHVRSAAMCGSCHTLRTEHTGKLFNEQSPYWEWRNSVYNDEQIATNGEILTRRTGESKSCRECHMPDQGTMRISRNPDGLDFDIPARPNARGHAFVGGNAFMLDLMRANAQRLGVPVGPEPLARAARATRAQLSFKTATVEVVNVHRESGAGGGEWLVFDAVVTNLTGHKFPTGYPSRRAWLDARVSSGEETVFESGGVDEGGRIRGLGDELGQPHRDVVSAENEVVIYEMVAADDSGKPTTYLSEMARPMKDSRLLPRGYAPGGPHAAETAPVGTEGDTNFKAGEDRVTYRVPIPAGARGAKLAISARLLYQTIPPAWVLPLRSVERTEAASFVEMYDAAKGQPEVIATGGASE